MREKQDELTLHWGMHTVRQVTLWRALTLGAHGEWGRSTPKVAGDHVVHDDTPFHSPQFFHKVTKVRRCLCPKMAAGSGAQKRRPGMCRSLGAKCGLQQAIMFFQANFWDAVRSPSKISDQLGAVWEQEPCQSYLCRWHAVNHRAFAQSQCSVNACLLNEWMNKWMRKLSTASPRTWNASIVWIHRLE